MIGQTSPTKYPCSNVPFNPFWMFFSMKVVIHENSWESAHSWKYAWKCSCIGGSRVPYQELVLVPPPTPHLIHHACISHCCHHPTPPQASNWNLLITDLTLYIQPEAFSVHLMWTAESLHFAKETKMFLNHPELSNTLALVGDIHLSFCGFHCLFFVAKFRIVLNGYCGITTSWVSVDQTAKKL